MMATVMKRNSPIPIKMTHIITDIDESNKYMIEILKPYEYKLFKISNYNNLKKYITKLSLYYPMSKTNICIGIDLDYIIKNDFVVPESVLLGAY